jgi:hypothetical protein
MKIDVHQHMWTEPLVRVLASRRELPFIARENGLDVLYLAGERPYVIDLESERPDRRAELVRRDGLDGALLCLSSPLGIEWLAREQAVPLIDAYLDGALSLDCPFGVWAAIALDRFDPDDVDRALERGCVGLSLPAGSLAGLEALAAMHPLLARLEQLDAPLFVHPGPAPSAERPRHVPDAAFGDPLWWPALTCYVGGMQAAYMAFLAAGRARYPELRVIFSMLAGLAPLHAERLDARGGPAVSIDDPLTFFETSSYGPRAVSAVAALVGERQLLYGSDRPVVEPGVTRDRLDWSSVAAGTERALGSTVAVGAR